jgi:hypothetical protein
VRFDREIIEYRLGIATLWIAALLLFVILVTFHGVAISFLVPSWFELDIISRGFAFILIGSFCIWVDIMSYRHVKGHMDRSRWIAEIRRDRESRNS